MRTVIADVTRANPGTEDALIRKLGTHYSSGDAVTVILREDQNSGLTDTYSAKTITPFHYIRVVNEINLMLNQVLADPDSTVDVVSFHSAVWTLKDSLAEADRNRVEFMPWSALSDGQGGSPGQTRQWPTELVSEEDALAVLQAALRRAGAVEAKRAIRKTDLRQALAREDQRFGKDHVFGATYGLMTMLTKLASERGCAVVEVQAGDFENPVLWVKDHASDAAQSVASSESEGRTRSQLFINTLRIEADLGPYSNIRWELYKALGDALTRAKAKTERLSVRSAVSEAIRSVQESQSERKINWRKVAAFLYRLLDRVPVMTDEEGRYVEASIGKLRAPVCGLVDDFEILLDGALILELVRRINDIDLLDIQDLAGALYLRRDDEALDRTIRVIERLLADRKVATTREKRLALVPENRELLSIAAGRGQGPEG